MPEGAHSARAVAGWQITATEGAPSGPVSLNIVGVCPTPDGAGASFTATVSPAYAITTVGAPRSITSGAPASTYLSRITALSPAAQSTTLQQGGAGNHVAGVAGALPALLTGGLLLGPAHRLRRRG